MESKTSNFVVFLVKTAVLFVVFWLISRLTSESATASNLPDWASWLILAAVASAFDYIVDVIIKPKSSIAGYTQYHPLDRA
jgi:phosphoglycerol transferase MdoB-like AlkP superfamily enzyme